MSTLIIAIAVFGLLILAHELGHFIAAKAAGIRVVEFSIGMGPSILSIKGKETLYSLRLLPIGGYNKMAGMEPGEEDDERGFNKQSVAKRMGVILAGSVMNFLLALFLFVIVFMILGTPSQSTLIGKVVPGSPAETAGLRAGDKILEVDGERVQNWNELLEKIQHRSGEKTQLLVDRGEGKFYVYLVPETDPETGKGMIGIWRAWERQSFYNSIIMGINQAVRIMVLLITSIVQMITGEVAPEVAGPVGIVQLLGEAAKFGVVNVLNFTAVLSLNLGLINLFPIPALDGSRLIFLGIEGITRRPVNPEKENFIHLVGFALLIMLMVVITYQDIMRIFQ